MSSPTDAAQFNWMLNNFVKDTSGVTDAVAVSSDGLLMAMSNTLDPAGADQVGRHHLRLREPRPGHHPLLRLRGARPDHRGHEEAASSS